MVLNIIEVLGNINNINLDKKIIEEFFRNVKWIGRFEVLGKKLFIVIDGVYNIDGIRVFRKNVEKYFKYDKMYFLFGILVDK